jgi:hypothetical protein
MDKGMEALIADMKSVAMKATPGPWRRTSTMFNGITHGPFSFTKEDVLGHFAEKCNAEFVSGCDPKNVLALIAALEQAQRNAMRYQFIRDKDAFGDESEPGLIGWDGLVELDANEFDAAIDSRMAHPGVAYTPAPNGMMQLSNELAAKSVVIGELGFLENLERIISERDRDIDIGQLGHENYQALMVAALDAFRSAAGQVKGSS